MTSDESLRQAIRSADLGGNLLSSKRYLEAAECYRRALAIDPDYEAACERLSDVELILKDSG